MDKTFMALDNMTRDIMRTAATLHMAFMGDDRLDHYPVPSMEDLLEGVFVLSASLSKALENQRLRLVDQRLLPIPEKGLVTTEGLKMLEANGKVERALGKGKSGKSYGKGKAGRGYHPYSYHPHSQGWQHGRGKGSKSGKWQPQQQGKGGRGQFKFKSDDSSKAD